jgi:hypothetical protein
MNIPDCMPVCTRSCACVRVCEGEVGRMSDY